MKTTRKTFFYLSLIMIVQTCIVGSILSYLLYSTAFEETKERLQMTAKSQARLIEAVARFDQIYSGSNYPKGASEATISQVIDAHKNWETFGATGEFVMGKLENDKIILLLTHSKIGNDPKPVLWESKIAEPMRRALSGQSGVMVGLDWRGKKVLAAYEPVDILNLGIVTKIDLEEVRSPFFRAGLIGAGIALVLIICSIYLFRLTSEQVIIKLEKGNNLLQKEINNHLQTHESLRKYEDLFSRSNDLAYICDDQGKIQYINNIFEQMTGHQKEEFLSKPFAPLFDEQNIKIVMAAFKQTFAGKSLKFEAYFKDTGILCEYESFPFFDNKGIIIGVMGTARDITKRKKLEEKLSQHKNQLESKIKERTFELETTIQEMQLIEHSLDEAQKIAKIGNWIFYPKEQKFNLSDQLRELYLSGSEDVTLDWVKQRIHPEDQRMFFKEFDSCINNKASYECEFRIIRTDGTLKYLYDTGRAICDPKGNLQHCVGLSQDITKRKMDENDLKKAYEELKTLDKMKDDLIETVSHELRTPMTSIIGFSETLKECNLVKKEGVTFVNNIIDSSTGLASLIENILDASSLTSGKLEFLFEPISLKNVLLKTQNMVEGLLENKKNVQIIFPELDNDIVLQIDEQRIVQVMVNLVSNAIKISPNHSSIKVDVTTDEKFVSVHIADQGPGIPPNSVTKIFEKFYQIKRKNIEIKGSGLGLAISKGIIDAHQGKIWVKNSKEGAVFSFSLPYRKSSLSG